MTDRRVDTTHQAPHWFAALTPDARRQDPRPISPFIDSVAWSSARPRPVAVAITPTATTDGGRRE